MKNKIISIFFSILAVLLMITVSIGLPIYFRPFYYAHISAMDLEYESGYTRGEIIDAYNEVLDYLTLPGKEFGTGVMQYSESGKDHFVDCKALFDLNVTVLIISAAAIATILILCKRGKLELVDINGYPPLFWSGVGAILIPCVLGLLISVDFDRAFVIFHQIFFPGKDNWTFDPRYDEIINVLPQEFFRNCAILIGVGLIALSATAIVTSVVKKRRTDRQSKI